VVAGLVVTLVDGVVGMPAVGQPTPGNMHRTIRKQRPREHPHQRYPALVRVHRGSYHLRNERCGRVDGHHGVSRSVGTGHWGRSVLTGSGKGAGQHLEELGKAQPAAGADWNDGVERAPVDRGLQVLDERVDVEVRTVEIAVHQGLVLALGDDPFDELVARRIDLVGIRGGWLSLSWRVSAPVVKQSLRQQTHQPGYHVRSVAHWQVERQHPATEGGPAGSGYPVEVGPWVVKPAHHHHPRHLDFGAFLPQSDSGGIDPVPGGDHEQRRVRRP